MSRIGDSRDETIPPLRHRFQVARVFGVILQHAPNLADGEIQPVLKIYVSVRLQTASASSSRVTNYFSCATDQDREQFCRLRLESYRSAVTLKLASATVQFVVAKYDPLPTLALCRQLALRNRIWTQKGA